MWVGGQSTSSYTVRMDQPRNPPQQGPRVPPSLRPPGLHVTYWWQIEQLLWYQAKVERWERDLAGALLAWANTELRNDE